MGKLKPRILVTHELNFQDHIWLNLFLDISHRLELRSWFLGPILWNSAPGELQLGLGLCSLNKCYARCWCRWYWSWGLRIINWKACFSSYRLAVFLLNPILFKSFLVSPNLPPSWFLSQVLFWALTVLSKLLLPLSLLPYMFGSCSHPSQMRL